MTKRFLRLLVTALLVTASAIGSACKAHDPGASDTAIKLGQTLPCDGPMSAHRVEGRVQAA